MLLKKSPILILFLFVSIYFYQLGFSQAYLIGEPQPEIKIDKDFYYPGELIYGNASWSIYPTGESISIRLSFYKFRTQNNELLYIIDLNHHSGQNFEEFFINSSVLGNNFINNTIILIYFEIKVNLNNLMILAEKNFTIGKTKRDFFTQIEPMSVEFDSNFFFSNYIVPINNDTKCISMEVFNVSLYNDNELIWNLTQYTDDDGRILFEIPNLIDYDIKSYSLYLSFDNTDYYWNQTIDLEFSIQPKKLAINLINDTLIQIPTILTSPFLNFSIYDTKNQTYQIPPVELSIDTNLTIINFTFGENLIIFFDYPTFVGNYFMNISFFSDKYQINFLPVVLEFYRNSLEIEYSPTESFEIEYSPTEEKMQKTNTGFLLVISFSLISISSLIIRKKINKKGLLTKVTI